jgi:hypothetical protein
MEENGGFAKPVNQSVDRFSTKPNTKDAFDINMKK